MDIEFKHLAEIEPVAIIALMNNPSVTAYLPLAPKQFDDKDCEKFLQAKEAIWLENGYGPWAFCLGGQFIGWGGLQPESDTPDLALVLHPDYWGYGFSLYQEIIKRAFDELDVQRLTALLPTARKNVRALNRLGFVEDGMVVIETKTFRRFRLEKQAYRRQL